MRCKPPDFPSFDIDVYDCPCGHAYGSHEYRRIESAMVIDRCLRCEEANDAA